MTENFTKVPNFIFEEYLPIVKPAEFCVLMVIARKTYGWHKTTDRTAQSVIVKSTGMSRNSVKNAVKNLIKREIISVNKVIIGNRFSYEYTINQPDRGSKIDTTYGYKVSEIDPLEGQKLTPESELEGQKLTPQKKLLNKDKERGGFETPSKENEELPENSGPVLTIVKFEEKKHSGELKMENEKREWKENVPDWLRKKVESEEGAEKLSETEKKFFAMGGKLPPKREPIVNELEQRERENMARQFVDDLRKAN